MTNSELIEENEKLKQQIKDQQEIIKLAKEVLARYYIESLPVYMKLLRDKIEEVDAEINKKLEV